MAAAGLVVEVSDHCDIFQFLFESALSATANADGSDESDREEEKNPGERPGQSGRGGTCGVHVMPEKLFGIGDRR